MPTTVTVDLGDRSYDVHVGPNARELLGSVIPSSARRAAVITQARVGWSVDPGIEHSVFEVAGGEEAKSLSEVEQLCRALTRAGFTRADVIVAVGGGAVTDLAGFAAAVYHRGIAYISVPTTLLAQVDAAIGGKTGVNLPEGKNLVGAFWQPRAVLCDTTTLSTLPDREMRSGQGELAKYHFLGGEDLDSMPLDERIVAAVAIKAAVVAGDEREGGRRAVLNYGHTLAHALETVGEYDLRHGEAVAIGLVYAAEVAYRLGRIDEARVAEHRRVVSGYDLPLTLPAGADEGVLVEMFHRDKKAVEGITMVLDGERGVEPVVGVPEPLLRQALAGIR